MQKLKPDKLRKLSPSLNDLNKIKRTPIVFVLDEIIDTYNIGSLFRLADAVAVQKMYLSGKMEYPPSSRIHKAAVGTENWVPWEKTKSTLETIQKLKERGFQIIAIEQDKKAMDYKNLKSEKIKFPVAVISGNETYGIGKNVLNEADLVVELPMLGINNSFNVWGATAVVTYKLLEFL